MERGEYGDGTGLEFSGQSYNFSLAQISFPLMDEEIKKLGGYVAQEPDTNAGDVRVISPEDLPQTIDEVPDDIINFAIKCEVTSRPFRIIASELQFLRQMKLPLPSVHPSVRLQAHLMMVKLGKSYPTICAKCGKSILSLFNPEDGFNLYCEDCFKREVY